MHAPSLPPSLLQVPVMTYEERTIEVQVPRVVTETHTRTVQVPRSARLCFLSSHHLHPFPSPALPHDTTAHYA